MSHIHIPDGVLPLWLVIAGYFFVALYLGFLTLYFKKYGINKKIALTGVFAALMLVTMSIEIIPPAYHLNLAVVSGIVLDPVLSILAILSTNIILALSGHGGISVIGLNTFVVGLEAVLGFLGFKFLYPKIKKAFTVSFIVTFFALFVSAWSSLGIIYLGTGDFDEILHHNEHNHEKIIAGHELENIHHDEQDHHIDFDPKRFILAILSLGVLGWVIESFITAFIINYTIKVRPDIIMSAINRERQ